MLSHFNDHHGARPVAWNMRQTQTGTIWRDLVQIRMLEGNINPPPVVHELSQALFPPGNAKGSFTSFAIISATVTYIFFGSAAGARPTGFKSMFKATPGTTPDQLQQSVCNRVIKNVADTFGKWNPFSQRAVSTCFVLFAQEHCPLTNMDPLM